MVNPPLVCSKQVLGKTASEESERENVLLHCTACTAVGEIMSVGKRLHFCVYKHTIFCTINIRPQFDTSKKHLKSQLFTFLRVSLLFVVWFLMWKILIIAKLFWNSVSYIPVLLDFHVFFFSPHYFVSRQISHWNSMFLKDMDKAIPKQELMKS